MNSWRFSSLEFAVLWSGLGRDILPGPLHHEPTAETQEDYRRDIDRAGAAVADQFSDNLHSALTAMALPDIRLNVYGYIGASAGPIRVHAVARERVGVVVVQATDDTVYLDRMGPARVCAQIIRALPRSAPGRGETLRVPLDNGRPAPGTEPVRGATFLRDIAAPSSPGQQRKRFMLRPRTAFGRVVVNPGPAVDNRPTDGGLDCYFADYAADGRYLVRRNAHSMEATPADDATLTGYLQRLVDTVAGRNGEDR